MPASWANEYTKWDGSQQFQAQSAEKAFDQISEYLMQYGDQVLRNGSTTSRRWTTRTSST